MHDVSFWTYFMYDLWYNFLTAHSFLFSILEAYRTGRGRVIIRGKTDVELLDSRTSRAAIIIKEVSSFPAPYVLLLTYISFDIYYGIYRVTYDFNLVYNCERFHIRLTF